MKKIFMLAIFISVFINYAFAEKIIAEDFYTSGRRYIDENVIEVSGVLPNTLMIKLSIGEEERVRADVLPEDANDDELLWSLPEGNGNIMIFPEGRECRVRAISEGNEKIRIDAPSGAHSVISVIVEKKNTPAKIETESEAEAVVSTEEKAGKSFSANRLLISAAVALLLAVLLSRSRKNENKR